ncbi:hypothetical protein GQR58_001758 [Nymphon striatum]|nr:hypothetical protein GQR58_001758 [Nymphon striatum]
MLIQLCHSALLGKKNLAEDEVIVRQMLGHVRGRTEDDGATDFYPLLRDDFTDINCSNLVRRDAAGLFARNEDIFMMCNMEDISYKARGLQSHQQPAGQLGKGKCFMEYHHNLTAFGLEIRAVTSQYYEKPLQYQPRMKSIIILILKYTLELESQVKRSEISSADTEIENWSV